MWFKLPLFLSFPQRMNINTILNNFIFHLQANTILPDCLFKFWYWDVFFGWICRPTSHKSILFPKKIIHIQTTAPPNNGPIRLFFSNHKMYTYFKLTFEIYLTGGIFNKINSQKISIKIADMNCTENWMRHKVAGALQTD